MYIVVVTVTVKPDHIDAFLDATLDNARNTRREPANLRFDVVRGDDPGRFVLYEVYASVDAFKAHQTTPHYLRWKDRVADMMAEPRKSLKGTPAFFGDTEQP